MYNICNINQNMLHSVLRADY